MRILRYNGVADRATVIDVDFRIGRVPLLKIDEESNFKGSTGVSPVRMGLQPLVGECEPPLADCIRIFLNNLQSILAISKSDRVSKSLAVIIRFLKLGPVLPQFRHDPLFATSDQSPIRVVVK